VAIGKRLRPPQFDTLPADFRELGPAYRAANAEGTQRWIELEQQSQAPKPAGSTAAPARQPWKSKATLEALGALDVPTLLMTGDADIYMPPPALLRIAKRMPRAETLMLREVNHSGYWEQPELFNRAVLEFIRKH
jgi:pimeloyl-ACP methyl ester carboxylesterase